MFGIADPLAATFLVCFFVGVLYVLVTAAMGIGHDAIHLPAFGDHAHGHDVGGAGNDAAGSAHDATSADPVGGHAASVAGDAAYTPSLISLFNVMAFLTVFGATGYVLHTSVNLWWPLSVLVALVAGGLAAWGTWLFLARVLIPGARATGADRVIGKVATVTMAVPAGGIGEVVYTLGGARHADGARSLDGSPIPRGAEVVIVRYEKGIAYVDTWEHFELSEGKQ